MHNDYHCFNLYKCSLNKKILDTYSINWNFCNLIILWELWLVSPGLKVISLLNGYLVSLVEKINVRNVWYQCVKGLPIQEFSSHSRRIPKFVTRYWYKFNWQISRPNFDWDDTSRRKSKLRYFCTKISGEINKQN